MQETQYLAAFDSENDGISYSEYLLLLTFLKISAQANRPSKQSLRVSAAEETMSDSGVLTPALRHPI